MLLNQTLEASARLFPDKVALITDDVQLTYGDIDRQSSSFARALRAQGIQRGDRVAIFLDNRAEAVIAIWATLKAGAVVMMMNPTTKHDKVAYLLNNARARVCITDATLIKRLPPVSPSPESVICCGPTASSSLALGGRPCFGWEELAEKHAQDATPLPKECIDLDLATLIYTSGSTGSPKGVMMSHHNVLSACRSIIAYLENTEKDIILNALPLSFDYGLYQIFMAFMVGATVVLERSFTYTATTLAKIQQYQITGFPIVPTMLAMMLRMNLQKFQWSSLRYITNTGAALPIEHIKRLRSELPHVQVYSMYGLTECKRVSYLPPSEIDAHPESVGRGMPNEDVYIVDKNGERVPPGIIGELVVRGSNVMKGYWEAPDETKIRLRPGPYPGEQVLYTGDLFHADHEGYLYFVGRRDDMIKTRGEKVSPKEVEEVLYRLDGVQEVAVLGCVDAVLGQRIKAVMVVDPTKALNARQVQRHCATYLEDYMVPHIVEFRPSLPKGATGKVDKLVLAEVSHEVHL